MRRIAVAIIGFAIGWTVYRIVTANPGDDLIRDQAHEFGSSTGE